ncbi:hypothetical protein WA026_020756 [Henosepilachna vigintioctopunctata]|uniref:Anion exchange protein n=1 Tax=Henosepilachna vigintioctopunctata TaxID=420089 RepID=A0AAW1TRR4_9CUCU
MQNRDMNYAPVRTVDDITDDLDGTPPSNERMNKDVHQTRHPIFSEMMELKKQGDIMVWRESARWLTFEEKVENGGRWSKPFVTTVLLHTLYDLRSSILAGTVILDMDATDFEQIARFLSSGMVKSNLLAPEKIPQLNKTLLERVIHQHQKRNTSCLRPTSKNNHSVKSANFDEDADQHNLHFMKKISCTAEACNIMVGGVDYLDKPLAAFIRLKSSVLLDNLTEVPVPTRFLFLLLGPPSRSIDFCEIGRALAACMSDEIFQDVAYRSANCEQLLAGLDEILKEATVLPPGKWNPNTRVQPCVDITSRNTRRRPIDKEKEELQKEEEARKIREETGLVRSGVLFGGLFNDIKRRAPWFWSDLKDGFHLQCIASWIFLYFACLSPIITFGALLSQVTGANMAAMESLVAGFVCGLLYGFFSGQPLTILASTGPVLVFETIVYDYCDTIGWDYMSFRFCIGTWIAVILMILVAVDASAFVCYITRFTEDNFTILVAVIFIYEAIGNVFGIEKKFPMGSVLYGNTSYESLPFSNESIEMQVSGEITTVPNNITYANVSEILTIQ